MPFIPHTEDEKQHMLQMMGIAHADNLFDEIPSDLKIAGLDLPTGMNEQAMLKWLAQQAEQDRHRLSFLGAGAYQHHIPAAVWDLASRGELLTSYTPYQAEASQGGLQIIYEYQSMICQLTAMEVANASVYDGATALTEAIAMAVRSNTKVRSKKILCLGALHPHYLDAVRSLVKLQGITIDHQPHHADTGQIVISDEQDYVAVVVQQPNFFGLLEDIDTITNWAHSIDALLIATVNPTSLALLKPPGQWGKTGADIAVGEGQPLGIPVAGGGPYFGFMCTHKKLVRQMPGRIVGHTIDLNGKPGFTLTLQTREQHIRRKKATSNICTNQGLLVTAATIYMSLLGPVGLRQVALSCHNNTTQLLNRLCRIPGISRQFDAPFFHEGVVNLQQDTADVVAQLAKQGILAGLRLAKYYPDLPNSLLLCATETKTPEDIEQFAVTLEQALAC